MHKKPGELNQYVLILDEMYTLGKIFRDMNKLLLHFEHRGEDCNASEMNWYVVLILEEIHNYDYTDVHMRYKHTRALIGFANTGDTNKLLLQFER